MFNGQDFAIEKLTILVWQNDESTELELEKVKLLITQMKKVII